MKRCSIQKPVQNRRGQGLVEYIIIIAAVALIALVSLSIFGHKVADQYAIGAGMLPGAHEEDNLPIAGGQFAESVDVGGVATGNGRVSWASITGNPDGDGELENNVVVFGSADGEAFVAD
jgi:hypothetical protein